MLEIGDKVKVELFGSIYFFGTYDGKVSKGSKNSIISGKKMNLIVKTKEIQKT